jgi:hypothetical protein
MSTTIDASRLTLLLNELRLPAIKHLWQQFAEQSDKEGWPAAFFRKTPFFLGFLLAEREVLTRAFGPRPPGDACASSKIAFGDFVEPSMGF